MSNKITKLTEQQMARMGEFVEKWTNIGLSCEPANRPEAERGIKTAYEIVGLSHPKKIVWCGSPLSQGLTRAFVFGSKPSEVAVEASVWASVGASVRDSVGASVWDSVWASVGDSVWASVGDSVWASVRDSVRASVRDSVEASVRDSVYGQHEAGWLSFYDYFKEVCSLEAETMQLCGLLQVAKSAGWWLPHQKICWVSERPSVLHRDNRGRLHCDIGPSLMYPDGWSTWSWHGVTVTQEIIEQPERITIDSITKEENTEIKRIMIERFGWMRYLQAVNANVIDFRKNEIEGTHESLIQHGEHKIIVFACPSTARVYSQEVPQEITSCEAAQNWLSSGLSTRIISAS